jgi:hypothetical protein
MSSKGWALVTDKPTKQKTNNKQQTTNNKQQTTNNKNFPPIFF